MQLFIILVVFSAVLALSFAAFNFFLVKKMPEGTEKMSQVAAAIRVGADALWNMNTEFCILWWLLWP